jgi:abortive infection alpha-like protein
VAGKAGVNMAENDDLIKGLPGLVRVATTASWKVFSWTVGSSVEIGTQIVRRTLNGDAPAQIIQDVSADLRSFAWRALGLKDDTDEPGVPDRLQVNGSTPDDLLARGENLLRRSADVSVTEEEHPAYARILSELTPDEARMLRFIYLNGPQPAIDVRTNRPLGIGSELVAGGLNMIAEHAGCRHVDRVHPYLTNLNRLGLIQFSKEQVENPNRYQLVEAQPKVAEVLKRAGRAPRIVHRSIHLNDFGTDFVSTCLPVTALNGFPANGERPGGART